MKNWINVLLLCTFLIPLNCFTQCNIYSMVATRTGCDPSDNTFDINGSIQFINPPTAGQLVIEDCNGNQQSFNAPFTNPINYTLADIDADGTTGCVITAYFTHEPSCNTSLPPTDYPQSCLCNTNVGTFTQSINGISSSTDPYLLCFGDELDIIGNGDFVAPPDFNMPGVTYDPGVFLFLYDCPPTVTTPNDLNTDPCLVGIASSNDQAWTIINNIGDSSTLWYVPVTMYSMIDGTYAASINGGDWCYDTGPAYEVTFLEEYEASINPILNDTLCDTGGSISLTATDTTGAWSSDCGTCLNSNGVFNADMANIGTNTIYYTVGDSICTFQDSLSIVVEQCLGITGNENEIVSIYPNPVSTTVTVTTESLIEKIKIVDLNGRLHDNISTLGTSKSIVDLSDYAQGIYLIEVTTNSGVLVNKLIVK